VAVFQRLIDEAVRGEIEVEIDKIFPISRADEPRTYIERRRVFAACL